MSWGLPQEERRFGGLSKRWVIIIASLFLISSTFAINITINGNNRVEFGQGIYQIKACDQYVSIQLDSTNTINGFSRVGDIVFSGLDVEKCRGTAMRLRFYQSGISTPSPIYTNADGTETGTAVIMVISKTATAATFYKDITLVNSLGVNVGRFDVNQQISFNRTTGSFTVVFTYPLAEMRNVDNVTLESASL